MATTQTKSRGDDKQKPGDLLKGEFKNLLGAFSERAIESVRDRVGETAGRLTDYADNGGGPGLMAAATGVKDLADGKSPVRAMLGAGMTGTKESIKGLFGGGKGGKGGKGKKLKVTNIVESADVGVPVRTVYNQWTQFRDFPSYTKKLESVEQESDEKLQWRAKIFWSTRNWESTIVHQVPDEAIIWRSKGAKGYVDGAVTFHELGPSLTKILLILEYHPNGFFEKTANLWRAQGRRARLEFKHFQRHVMTQTILTPDEIEGWRGTIEDGEVVKDHETAVSEEQGEDAPGDEGEYEEEEYEPEPGAGEADEAGGEEAGEYEPADEPADEEAEYEPADEEAGEYEPADEEAEYEPDDEPEPDYEPEQAGSGNGGATTGRARSEPDGEAAGGQRTQRSRPPVTRRRSASGRRS